VCVLQSAFLCNSAEHCIGCIVVPAFRDLQCLSSLARILRLGLTLAWAVATERWFCDRKIAGSLRRPYGIIESES
jgi:hypothetical protein